jgi:ubiquinone/menaquinone biosynthesis C-methylase UbiE
MTTQKQTPGFDPLKYKVTTREQWNSAAEAWNKWGPFIRKWLGPATESLMDMAEVAPGNKVLVVAAGAGDEALQIAERVGSGGFVLASDLSPGILEFAAKNAEIAGFRNIETKVLDGENLDTLQGEEFDAVISRVGLIYLPDQQRALRGMKHVLKRGGRIGAIVYSTPSNNEFFSIPVSIIRRRANLPPPVSGQPGPFSLGGEGVLENLLQSAGFAEVQSKKIKAPLYLPSAEECLRFEKESFGALHAMLATLGEREKEEAWNEIRDSLKKFESTEGGFEGPCELIVATGRKVN